MAHFYRLYVTDPQHHEELNKAMAGPRFTSDDKPEMITEAARTIPVPSWWQGNSITLSEAQMAADRMKGK